jgi:hypothetical protein
LIGRDRPAEIRMIDVRHAIGAANRIDASLQYFDDG